MIDEKNGVLQKNLQVFTQFTTISRAQPKQHFCRPIKNTAVHMDTRVNSAHNAYTEGRVQWYSNRTMRQNIQESSKTKASSVLFVFSALPGKLQDRDRNNEYISVCSPEETLQWPHQLDVRSMSLYICSSQNGVLQNRLLHL